MSIPERFHAWALIRGMDRYEAMVAQRKARLFEGIGGTVVEIGPGAGPNLRYCTGARRWIGIEPNPYLHAVLRGQIQRLGIEGEVLQGEAEAVPLPDRSADAVIATLVLCSVADPSAVLREVRRVLRPGGTFYFFEHVAAPAGSVLRGIQRMVRPAWKLLTDNCHPDRETEELLRSARFGKVEVERFILSLAVVAPHIAGRAVALPEGPMVRTGDRP
jgi:ubiquinone/menaquinone biosynthesis C-methylase UbiE